MTRFPVAESCLRSDVIQIAGKASKCSNERMQLEFPRIGQRCWLRDVTAYPLPRGLLDRSLATVIAVDGHRVIVRDEQGHEFDLPRINIDSGYILFLDGASVRESHPKFAAYFRHALSEIAQKTNPMINKEELVSHWRWLLERNGFDPDEPVRAGPPPRIGSPPTSSPRSPRSPQNEQPRRMRS